MLYLIILQSNQKFKRRSFMLFQVVFEQSTKIKIDLK